MDRHRSLTWSGLAKGCLALLALLAAAGCTPRQVASRVFARPPIIIVDIDTLRADHLGVYGYARDTSPQIDAFARDAVRFEWAFSQAPNTPPSQTSIFTGLYPIRHGRIGNNHVLADEVTTLAESLHAVGYETAAFVDGGLMADGFGLEQGFDIYDDGAGGLAKIGKKALDWLDARQEDPFFLLVHTYDVHSPYENSPEPYRSMFLDGFELPSEAFRDAMSGAMAEAWQPQQLLADPQLTEAELNYAKAMYDSGIRYVDDWFGTLRAFLERRGLWEPAIVVVVSDHGDEFQEHGSLFHEKLYAAVTHIPLIIKLPGAGPVARIDAVAESIDLMPTLLALAEAPVPPDIDGESLMPLIEGTGESDRRLAISESPFYGRRVAFTTRDHRMLVSLKTKETELYAYREDRQEANDISEDVPRVAYRLRRGAIRWNQAMKDRSREAAERNDLKDETIQQLKALGYLR